MKLFKGIFIGVLSVILCMTVLVGGYIMIFSPTVVEITQRERNIEKETQMIIDNMEWRQSEGYLVGTFNNTTGELIAYLELDYKFLNGNNILSNNFVTTDFIYPGESAEIKIPILIDNYDRYYIKVINASILD